jgi:hypothetical protein
MQKWTWMIVCLGLVAPLLAGCGHNPNSVQGLSRAEQEKAFAGDPVKAKEMAAKMQQQYMQKYQQHPPTARQPPRGGTTP